MTEFTYHVEVVYNEQRDEYGRLVGIWTGWEPGHDMRLVWEYDVTEMSPERALEVVFRDFNRVDAPCLADAANVRSMSVGDVVTLTLGQDREPVGSWTVAPVGWQPIRTQEVHAR